MQPSPQTYARTGGVLYLIIIIVGLFGEAFVRNRLIIPGDATATAANIRSMESLWRLHIAAELFLLICAVALLLILFVLLQPVNRDLALLAVFFNLISIGLEAATTLYLVGALFPLGKTGYLKAGYLPKALGVLMQIAGLSYLTNSFALVLAPALANRLFPAILIPAFVGEASLCLWLIVKGVNVSKWQEQVSAGRFSGA